MLKSGQCVGLKQGSIPIFYKNPFRVEINQIQKNPYLLEHSPHRIYILYFLVRRFPTIGTLTSFSPSFSLLFFSFPLSLFLSFLSLPFLFPSPLLSIPPPSKNCYHLPFIHIPTCMHVDTCLAMCHAHALPCVLHACILTHGLPCVLHVETHGLPCVTRH